MGKHVDSLLTHQRRHTHGVAHVLHKDQEGRAIRHKTAMQGDTVHHRAHAEFTHTVVQVVAAGIVGGDRFRALPERQIRWR